MYPKKRLDYEKNLNRCVNRVSKSNLPTIKKEISNVVHRPDLPRYEKKFILNKLYNKLDSRKQREIRNYFGQTVAPTTTTTNPVASASVPVASVSVPAASVSIPAISMPAISIPAASVSVPAVSSVAAPVTSIPATTTSATIVQPQSYNQLASAVQNLETAAGQLLQTAAGQNISG